MIIYLVISFLLFAWLTFAWSSVGALNCLIKTIWVAMAIVSLIFILAQVGLVLPAGVKLI